MNEQPSHAWAPTLPPAQLPPLEGRIEGVEAGVLHGWVSDPARPLWPVAFELMIGGRHFGRTLAADRPDPATPHRHRFSVPLPAGQTAGLLHVRLVQIGTGRALEGSLPDTAAASPAVPRIRPILAQTIVPEPPPPPAPAIDIPAQPEALRAAVEQAFRAEDWPRVLLLTDRAVPERGAKAEHRLVGWRGRAFLYLRRFDEAAATLAWFEAQMPTQHHALFFLAQSLAGLQQLGEAWRVFSACLALKPEEPKYVLEAARVATRLVNGDYGAAEPQPALLPEALFLLRRAAQLSPRDARPLRELGHLLLQFDEPEAGLAALRDAAALVPGQAVAQLDLARALTRLGRLEPALEAARAALALEPQRDGAAFAVRLLERWAEARRAGPFHATLATSQG